jgi:MFS family permease
MGFRVVGRMLVAQGLSSLGTSMSTIALAFMVFDITGSVLHMGGIMAASTLPLVATVWIGGAFLDRYSARSIMVLADAVRAVLIFSVPFLAQRAIGAIYIVAALMGVFTGVFNPAQIKIIGEVVEPRLRIKANSYLGVARDGAELIGYLAGGVLVTYVGYTLAFGVDALSYAISAALLVGLPRGLVQPGAAPRIRVLVAESPAVLGRLWRHPGLRTNLLLAVFGVAAVMTHIPNSYGLALEVFDRGATGLATLEVFVAVGLILGGLLYSRLRLSGDKNAYVFYALVSMAVCLVAISFSEQFWLSITLMGLVGVASVGLVVPSITLVQEVPASGDKGRIIALRTGFGQLGVTAGYFLGGLLGAELGITRLFFVAGIATIAISLAIYIPHRMSASRRAKNAWATAVESGATRSAARQMAQEAAFSGNSVMTSAAPSSSWAAAEAVPSGDET